MNEAGRKVFCRERQTWEQRLTCGGYLVFNTGFGLHDTVMFPLQVNIQIYTKISTKVPSKLTSSHFIVEKIFSRMLCKLSH